MATKISKTDNENFICNECDYICYKKQHYIQHCETTKHKNRIGNISATDKSSLCCENCNKTYIDRSGLWRHKKKCKNNSQVTNNIPVLDDNKLLRDFIVEQAKQYVANVNSENQELRNFIIEQSKQHVANINEIVEKNAEIMNKVVETIKPVNNTINQTNNNQRFNINVFLNETCKDAINFSDFVNNIQISYEDLENNARLGFVNGISKIFLDNLNQLDISERPIHCTDVKRETMYIKDDNTWTKQTDNEKLQKAIQAVSYRSMGKLGKWKQENPDYNDADSEFSQRCLVIQKNTLAGDERGVYYPKVIHALARETVVEK
jgi:hypothetical protein